MEELSVDGGPNRLWCWFREDFYCSACVCVGVCACPVMDWDHLQSMSRLGRVLFKRVSLNLDPGSPGSPGSPALTTNRVL